MSLGTLVLGNSVSAQRDGYVSALDSCANSRDIRPIVNASLGGVGSIGLVALHEPLVGARRADLVILETSLGDAAGATNLQDLPLVLQALCDRALEVATTGVVALHIPRFDVSRDVQATVVAIHERTLRDRGIPSLDLSTQIAPQDTVDGVHLTPAGSRIVAQHLATFIQETSLLIRDQSVNAHSSPRLSYIPVSASCWRTDGEKASFRATLPSTRLGFTGSASIDISGVEPLALVVIVGPRSGVISIRTPHHSVNLQTWDQWCTFRRIQIVHLPREVRISPHMEIRPVADSFAPIDAWGVSSKTEHAGEILEVVGILVNERPTGEEGRHG